MSSSSISIVVSVVVVVVIFVVVVSAGARRKGYSGMGGDTIVRCGKGHLFTTIWVPLASLKAVRLGTRRLQYCPVGKHWALVKPVKESTLSDEERRRAALYKDLRIP